MVFVCFVYFVKLVLSIKQFGMIHSSYSLQEKNSNFCKNMQNIEQTEKFQNSKLKKLAEKTKVFSNGFSLENENKYLKIS